MIIRLTLNPGRRGVCPILVVRLWVHERAIEEKGKEESIIHENQVVKSSFYTIHPYITREKEKSKLPPTHFYLLLKINPLTL